MDVKKCNEISQLLSNSMSSNTITVQSLSANHEAYYDIQVNIQKMFKPLHAEKYSCEKMTRV